MPRRRLLPPVGMLAGLALAIFSCAESDRIPFEPAFRIESGATGSFLPFPNDLLTVEDTSTRTGLRLSLRSGAHRDLDRLLSTPDTIIGHELLSPIVRTFSFEEMRRQMNELDGFSLLSPILIALSAPVDTSSLPSLAASATPASSIWLVDTTAFTPGGSFSLDEHRVPFSTGWEPSGYQVVIDPLLPLEGGRSYMVVLRTSPRDREGRRLRAPPSYRELVDGTLPLDGWSTRSAARVRAFHNEVLAPSGSDPALAFEFTVQSGADDVLNAIGILGSAPAAELSGLQAHTAGTLQDPEQVAIARSISGSADLIRGIFRSIDFRDADDLMPPRIERGDPLPTRTSEIEFVLVIPSSPRPAGGYPIAILQHGLGAQKLKEDKWHQFAGHLADAGVASIAIDAMRHGFRASPEYRENPGVADLSWVLDLIDFSNPPRTRDNLRQNFLDLWQLSNRAIPTLSSIDLPTCGRGCLDTSRKGYAGESLGGILGSGYTSIDVTMRAAVLYVGGGELTQLVRGDAANRYLFLLGLANNCPPEVLVTGLKGASKCEPIYPSVFAHSDSPAAENLLFLLAQTLVDRGDPALYATGKYRRPFFTGNDANSTLMIEAVGETTVTNVSTEVLAASFGLPHLNPNPPGHPVAGLTTPDPLAFPLSSNGPSGATYGFVQISDPASPAETGHTYPLESERGSRLGADFLISALVRGRAEIAGLP